MFKTMCMEQKYLLNFNCDCISINVDNKVANYNSENKTINSKSRHTDVKYPHSVKTRLLLISIS
jgi:hypothetical protein